MATVTVTNPTDGGEFNNTLPENADVAAVGIENKTGVMPEVSATQNIQGVAPAVKAATPLPASAQVAPLTAQSDVETNFNKFLGRAPNSGELNEFMALAPSEVESRLTSAQADAQKANVIKEIDKVGAPLGHTSEEAYDLGFYPTKKQVQEDENKLAEDRIKAETTQAQDDLANKQAADLETQKNETDAGTDIADTKSEMETLLESRNKELDAYSATLSSRSKAAIARIQESFEIRKNQQDQINKALLAGERTRGFSSGRARFASTLQGQILSNEESAGIARLASLDAQEQQLIAEAEAAAEDSQFDLLNEKFNNAINIQKEKEAQIIALGKLANEQEKNVLAQMKAIQDQNNWEADYNLKVEQFLSKEALDIDKADLNRLKTDIDIGKLTGEWNGASTMAEKKRISDDAFRALGIEIDQEKLNEMIRNNSFNRKVAEAKFSLDEDKFKAEQQGVDVSGAAERIFNGTSTLNGELKLMKDAGGQALRQAVSEKSIVLKEAAKNTDNPMYDFMASQSFTGSLNATDRQNLDKVFMVAGQMDNLKAAFDKLKNSGKAGAIIGKIQDKNFMDKDVVTFKAALAGIIPTVARGIYGEVGVLTDNDMNRYSKAVANIDNPVEAFDKIFSNMLETLEDKATTTLKNAANAGINVSNFSNDYRALVDGAREMRGADLLQVSSNPTLYNNVNDFAEQIGRESFTEWYDGSKAEMDKFGIKDIEDYFNGLKQLASPGMKDIQNEEPQVQQDFSKDLDMSQNGLGSLSEKYESGGDPGAIGYDRVGGSSYGRYQMTEGSVNEFLKNSQFANELGGLQFGSQEFNDKWKNIAINNSAQFGEEQRQFIEQSHYKPQEDRAISLGLDITNPAVKDVIWSTAVQHGANNTVLDNVVAKYGNKLSPEDLINAIYNERWSNGQRFVSSTQQVQDSVLNRFRNERNQALSNLV